MAQPPAGMKTSCQANQPGPEPLLPADPNESAEPDAVPLRQAAAGLPSRGITSDSPAKRCGQGPAWSPRNPRPPAGPRGPSLQILLPNPAARTKINRGEIGHSPRTVRRCSMAVYAPREAPASRGQPWPPRVTGRPAKAGVDPRKPRGASQDNEHARRVNKEKCRCSDRYT